MAKTEAKAYKIHFEVLRLLAIFLVVFNHTKEKGFDFFEIYSKGYD